MKIVKYPKLKYTAIFNEKIGFFARIEDKNSSEPFWSPYGPELLDIAITNWCDRGCSFCYRKSGSSGKHMTLANYKKIIDVAKRINVFQVALGGGNPNQHPEFISILEYTQQSGIVPNYTTNGRGLTHSICTASKKFCGAVAVSAYAPYDEMEKAIIDLTSHGIKTNVHFLLDAKSIITALNWLNNPPEILTRINALVFLNYKPIGRKISPNILKTSEKLDEFYQLATTRTYPFKIGFDACSVSALFSRTDYNTNFIEACDAARFSMFISEDMRAYPCSFQKIMADGDSICKDGDFVKIWQRSPAFKTTRRYFASNACPNCSHQKNCLNGCPVFENIKLCKEGHFFKE